MQTGNYFRYVLHAKFYLISALLLTAISLYARFSVALYPTQDVVGYVFKWMKNIQEVGFAKFYTIESEYSPLFLFLVGLYTFLPTGKLITVNNYAFYQNWMYYVKGTYFAIEIVIAVGIYLLIKAVTNNKKYAWLGYVIFLCLPVQFFNSAVWGNSDTMYFACFVFILYFLVTDKGAWAFFLTGVGLGLKLQAVFILPFLVYLIASGKLRFYKIVLLPVGLFSTFLPAYLCGASFTQPFHFWSEQVGGYSLLTLGCANIWHLINLRKGAMEQFTQGATVIGLLLIGLFMAILFARKIQLTKENTCKVGIFLIAIVPMFLPHMHERYFYALDVLIVVYCLITKKHYWLIVLMQLSSGIAYHNYLSGRHFIVAFGEDSVHIASWINIFVLSFLFYQLLKLPSEGTMEEVAEKYKREIETFKPVNSTQNLNAEQYADATENDANSAQFPSPSDKIE